MGDYWLVIAAHFAKLRRVEFNLEPLDPIALVSARAGHCRRSCARALLSQAEHRGAGLDSAGPDSLRGAQRQRLSHRLPRRPHALSHLALVAAANLQITPGRGEVLSRARVAG